MSYLQIERSQVTLLTGNAAFQTWYVSVRTCTTVRGGGGDFVQMLLGFYFSKENLQINVSTKRGDLGQQWLAPIFYRQFDLLFWHLKSLNFTAKR